MSKGLTPAVVFVITLILSSCSILYEFLLAQCMSATMGNTFLRYNLTIGFYLASLGLGAILCAKRSAERSLDRLIGVELAVTWLGVLAPFLIILWDGLVYKASHVLGFGFRGLIYQSAIYLFNHALVIAVGLLSGFELPLLMHLGAALERDRSNDVLALDYFGTLIGALSFPLLLLPGVGVINTAILTALANAFCGIYLLLFFGEPGLSRRLIGFLAVLLFCLVLLLNSDFIHGRFLDVVYRPY